MEKQDLLQIAARFIQNTDVHLFVTGKAGTGKTTFLRHIAATTHKRHVIVAPTGIAALNANGTTIHSQFLLPFGTFLPGRNAKLPEGARIPFFNQELLVRRHTLNAARKRVLRDIELLIIDEVSMLRADILDAIDFRLRHARGEYNLPFGGVQLLLIGDLYQLPPIVKDEEWHALKSYYSSIWFFNSLGLQAAGMVHLELDKIFRQSDETFIGILNNLRNNTPTKEDIDILNKHFLPDAERKKLKDVITLTTHNYRADAINQDALKALKGSTKTYYATIEGDFPEGLFPVLEAISLKVGSRVMFVKNDGHEGRYYNGKLATITALGDDLITVLPDEENTEINISPVEWENKRYAVSEQTSELEEEVVGTFSHLPIKLAWAITVHKSQGLTFDKAVIDVGKAFAPGQVYVALSRLRSLDGLILGTLIDPNVVSTDAEVTRYSTRKQQEQPPLQGLLDRGQQIFLLKTLSVAFNYNSLFEFVKTVHKTHHAKGEFEDQEMEEALPNIAARIERELDHCATFNRQLSTLLEQKDFVKLMERIEKGTNYFSAMLEDCLERLLVHIRDVEQLSKVKTYLNDLGLLDVQIMHHLQALHRAVSFTNAVLSNVEANKDEAIENRIKSIRSSLMNKVFSAARSPKALKRKSGKKRTTSKGVTTEKHAKESTYDTTLSFVNEGLSIKEISEKRNLTMSTIEGHIAKLISDNKLDIKNFMDTQSIQTIAKTIAQFDGNGIKEVVTALDGKFTYGQVRMVQAVMRAEID